MLLILVKVVTSIVLLVRVVARTLLSELVTINIWRVEYWILFHESSIDLEAKVARSGQGSHLWLEQLEELSLFWLNCNLNSLLNDIITILVGQVLFERACFHNLIDHLRADHGICTLKTLFNNIRRELFLAENEKLTEKLLSYDSANLRNLEVQDILNNIVGKSIFHEFSSMLSYRHCEGFFLLDVGCINTFLHNAATMHVTGYVTSISHHCLVDKLLINWRP